jgi:hypothetical protein
MDSLRLRVESRTKSKYVVIPFFSSTCPDLVVPFPPLHEKLGRIIGPNNIVLII